MVLGSAKWSELCGAKTPMMQRKGDKSQGGIAFTNTQRQQIHRYTQTTNTKIHKHTEGRALTNHIQIISPIYISIGMIIMQMTDDKVGAQSKVTLVGKLVRHSNVFIDRMETTTKDNLINRSRF